jgi:hypothetical protein
MRQLVLVALVAVLSACPSAPRPILTDSPQARSAYHFVTVNKAEASNVEAMLERAAIVTRYSDHGRVAYVVRDTDATKPVRDQLALRSLDKATLVVRVARTSDINGWGVGVNGEVHRTRTLELDLGTRQLASAFTLLQELHTTPLETIERVWPHSLDSIETPKEVALFERGYVVDVEATLVTGNPFDRETRVQLYGMSTRSGYRAL